MGYKRADQILPNEILELLQRYVSGETIYVPGKQGSKRKWGSNTGTKEDLYRRNRQILAKCQQGASVSELAAQYYLTEKSIRRILKATGEKPPMEKDGSYQEEDKIE